MGLTLSQAGLPVRDALVTPPRFKDDPLGWLLSTAWLDWLTRLAAVVNQCANRINYVVLTNQGASIAATDFSGAELGAGLYRVTYYTRILRAAGTSSSVTVAFGWNDGGVAQTWTAAAMTGNTLSTNQTGSILVRIDGGSPITYAVTYASVGIPAALYRLDVVLELIQA